MVSHHHFIETQIVECPLCEGEGEWESSPYGYSHIDGSLLTHTVTCSACNGHGVIEDAPDLLTLEDALDLDAEIALAEMSL